MTEVTYGLMAHKVVVTVGELHGADIDNYLNITQKGGTCVLTAIGSLMDTNVTLNLAMLTLMQKNLQGTIFGGGNPQFDIPQLLSMYKAGKLNLDDMITRQYRSSRSTRATRTCWTARTFAASSATRTPTGKRDVGPKPSKSPPHWPLRSRRGAASRPTTGRAGWP